jgi:hypothetical protein
MKEGKKNTFCMLFLGPFWSCFGFHPSSRASKSKCSCSGPEAAMLAAAKHFSSAHKVRFG